MPESPLRAATRVVESPQARAGSAFSRAISEEVHQDQKAEKGDYEYGSACTPGHCTFSLTSSSVVVFLRIKLACAVSEKLVRSRPEAMTVRHNLPVATPPPVICHDWTPSCACGVG